MAIYNSIPIHFILCLHETCKSMAEAGESKPKALISAYTKCFITLSWVMTQDKDATKEIERTKPLQMWLPAA